MRTKLFALYAVVALTLAAVGPGIAAVGAEDGNAPLNVSVSQADDGGVTVEVTQNDSGVADANVSIEAVDDTYAGEGEYTSDENGTVDLPAPQEPVTVNVTAEADNQTAATTAELAAADLAVGVSQDDDGSVTVSVTTNGSGAANASVVVEAVDDTYAGEGEYTTDDAGTVGLPAPREPVTVDVTASVDNLTATTTADLAAANVTENQTFGQRMSAFVHAMQEVGDSPIGPYVAAFAVENNPGNAPDHAGPPAFLFGEGDDRGPPWLGEDDETDDNETEGEDGNETDDERGPPEHAGPPDDEERGPPEHAGPPGDDDRDEGDEEAEEEDAEDDEDESEETDDGEEEDGDEDETDDEDDDNGDRGPPEHAGPPE